MLYNRNLIVLILFLLSHHPLASQSFLTSSDTFSKSRFFTLAGAGTLLYGTTVVGLNQAWYKGFEKTSFHFFNDRGEWQNMDKIGHVFTTYFESEVSYRGLRWTGMKDRNAIWLATGLGIFYQGTIEVFDGYSSRWGFSGYDMMYNVLGSALFASQQLGWKEQRMRLKVSSWQKNYGGAPINSSNSTRSTTLDARAKELFGASYFERYLKDYNAQTIWLSFNVPSFFPRASLPSWLNLSLGYGSENLFGGFANTWVEKDNAVFTLSSKDFPRTRQWYLAPDIDFRKIKTENALLKSLFTVLNIFKIPSPAFEINSEGKIKWHWIFL
jgi:hypothetical protein